MKVTFVSRSKLSERVSSARKCGESYIPAHVYCGNHPSTQVGDADANSPEEDGGAAGVSINNANPGSRIRGWPDHARLRSNEV